MKSIDFYFDPISPYVYLAWTQLPKLLEETGANLRCVPVLFAGLLNAHGQKGPAEIPSKRIYTVVDTVRWARYYGLPFQGPPTHPFNPLLPLRFCVALENEEDRRRWAGAIIEGAWGRGLDISSLEGLRKLATELGLSFEQVSKRAESLEVKEQLKKNTEEAIQKGVFGVPTFWVEGEIFWGNDRLSFLKDFLLKGERLDPETLEKVLNRPRGADRKNHR